MSFHFSLVTLEYYRVRPKWFPKLWYIWCKLCTYLTSTITPSPNVPKRGSPWPRSPRSTIGCIQNDSRANGAFGANRAPILHQHRHRLQTDWNNIRHDPCHLAVPSGASKMVSLPMVHSELSVHLSYTNTSTVSKLSETRFHMTHVT
jgi:hypothetical protein